MRKRRYQSPDGLDWRDPNMPVLRYGKVNGVQGYHLVSSEHIKQYYAAKLNSPFYNPPSYNDDPSYWWNKRNGKSTKKFTDDR